MRTHRDRWVVRPRSVAAPRYARRRRGGRGSRRPPRSAPPERPAPSVPGADRRARWTDRAETAPFPEPAPGSRPRRSVRSTDRRTVSSRTRCTGDRVERSHGRRRRGRNAGGGCVEDPKRRDASRRSTCTENSTPYGRILPCATWWRRWYRPQVRKGEARRAVGGHLVGGRPHPWTRPAGSILGRHPPLAEDRAVRPAPAVPAPGRADPPAEGHPPAARQDGK